MLTHTLSEVNGSDGTLTPAARIAYSTWGTPTITAQPGYGSLGFRYLYVGRFDVQWDDTTAAPAGLLYMHARHYSPEFGRFLQPDPAAAEANLFGYASNSPATVVDAQGTWGHKLCMCAAAGLGRGVSLRAARSLKGLTIQQLKSVIPKNWSRSAASHGIGVRYTKPGVQGAYQVRIMKGKSTNSDPVKKGHYVRVTWNGKVSPPIPLAGNPALK